MTITPLFFTRCLLSIGVECSKDSIINKPTPEIRILKRIAPLQRRFRTQIHQHLRELERIFSEPFEHEGCAVCAEDHDPISCTVEAVIDEGVRGCLVPRDDPVIYPNRRNAKTPIAIARKFRWFRKDIYKDRYKVERTFGWKPDTYRKLALSYDKLKETRLGFRYLAYSMINFRITFNES